MSPRATTFSLSRPEVTCCLSAEVGLVPGVPLLRTRSTTLTAKPPRNTATAIATAHRSPSSRGVQGRSSVITAAVLAAKTRTGTPARHATDRQDPAPR
ncbi:hypothetical protein [Micromonospora wenchangensis]|uniref:hypothetical protein n=1 Tax=Micromonospora wenchangensis TaxID=1185415 RepID=UPI003827EC0F